MSKVCTFKNTFVLAFLDCSKNQMSLLLQKCKLPLNTTKYQFFTNAHLNYICPLSPREKCIIMPKG